MKRNNTYISYFRYDNNLYWSKLNEEQLISHFKQLSHCDIDNEENYKFSKKEMLMLQMAFEIGYNIILWECIKKMDVPTKKYQKRS